MSEPRFKIKIDYNRDEIFSDFAKAIFVDNCLLPGEKPQDAFARVAVTYGDDQAHAQRLYDYMSQQWFTPSSPVMTNGGTSRGLPISCFLNEMEDSLEGISATWMENIWLAALGGGIGTFVGNVRSVGERVGRVGTTCGVVPFIKVQDAITMAVSQGSLRRGASAVYMQIDHPEIIDFIDLRRFTGGDPNRKAQYLHHGVTITDAFMRAVEEGKDWDLVSPKDGSVRQTVKARDLWIRLLTARVEMGEPYILFIDTINKHLPQHQKDHGLSVKMSNLCSEISLVTGRDHLGKMRTAVCCLSSVNIDKFDEWQAHPTFIEDMMRYLDNILEDFIERAPDHMANAKYSAMRERSVGLGAMGFHSFLQKYGIPFESAMAKVWNKKIFAHIRSQADAASRKLADERGACPDAEHLLVKERFSHKLSIAPNSNSAIMCNNVSPGIEPFSGNVFVQKTKAGSFAVRNRYLKALLAKKGYDDADTWSGISTNNGSVQHLDCLTPEEKAVFKTAFEIDQRWIVEHASDRTPYVCQMQSTNIFLAADAHKATLHGVHMMAWKKGLKSLYYCRSRSIQRADIVSNPSVARPKDAAAKVGLAFPTHTTVASTPESLAEFDECLSCQG